ncbi:MAG: winged helix-turn-helix transcriptional regulator [Lactobacillaceae bacterium]|nr:winged helix-turn-helix transcriptional regulator [Lactobacillaceae bacterium]
MKTEYTLTTIGRSLLPIVDSMVRWVNNITTITLKIKLILYVRPNIEK